MPTAPVINLNLAAPILLRASGGGSGVVTGSHGSGTVTLRAAGGGAATSLGVATAIGGLRGSGGGSARVSGIGAHVDGVRAAGGGGGIAVAGRVVTGGFATGAGGGTGRVVGDHTGTQGAMAGGGGNTYVSGLKVPVEPSSASGGGNAWATGIPTIGSHALGSGGGGGNHVGSRSSASTAYGAGGGSASLVAYKPPCENLKETVRPISVVLNNLSGTAADIDDDPDSPDGAWLTASLPAVLRTQAAIRFGARSQIPIGRQEFRVLVRATVVDTPVPALLPPTVTVALRNTASGNDNIVEVSEPVLSTVGQVVSLIWDASVLGTPDDPTLRCFVQGDPSVLDTVGWTVEVGAAEWLVNEDECPQLSVSGGGSGIVTGDALRVGTVEVDAGGTGELIGVREVVTPSLYGPGGGSSTLTSAPVGQARLCVQSDGEACVCLQLIERPVFPLVCGSPTADPCEMVGSTNSPLIEGSVGTVAIEGTVSNEMLTGEAEC